MTHRLETILIHAGGAVDAQTGAIAPPIHLSTTFQHPADVALLDGYIYQRYSNPTQDRVEEALVALEGSGHALYFATGLAAAAAMLHTLNIGDRVLLADDTYFAIRKLFVSEGARMGIVCELVDMTDLSALAAALQKPAAMIWLETPSNPLMKVTDIAAVVGMAKPSGAQVVVDATFATPLLQRPLHLGADVVLHSTTKYLSGHSDNMGGSLVVHDQALWERLYELRKLLGGTASPFSAWMTLRGIRTLACRMQWHCESAKQIAQFLQTHAHVAVVHYPGLESHPQHAIAKAQMRDFGGMLSFEVHGGYQAAVRVAGKLKIFTNATSLGSTESLVEHRKSAEGPTSTTPAGLLRLSVGLEHAQDLIDDLAQALAP